MDGSSSARSLSIVSPSEINLTSTVLDQNQRLLMLTAANTGTGTTTSALALTSQLAGMTSGPVLLVDVSANATNVSQRLGLHKVRGFRDLLFNPENTPPVEDCIVHMSSLSFDVLPVGRDNHRNDRLRPECVRPLLKQLVEQYRFVVIDSDAVYAAADTLVISTLVDGVILVVQAEDTRWEVAQAAAHRLTQAGATLIGSVFNRRRYYMPKWLYRHL